MKIGLQFSINCDRCPKNDVFNSLMLFVDQKRFGHHVLDARTHFDKAGWMLLPSGKWICRSHGVERDAAAGEPQPAFGRAA